MQHCYRKSDFFYDLPEALIARYPLENRGDSRLLVARASRDGLALQDSQMAEFEAFLNPEDLLVVNDTRVLPARLFGEKSSGGKVEILIERLIDAHTVRAYVRASKAPAVGSILHVGQANIAVEAKENGVYRLVCAQAFAEIMQAYGQLPIPPYLAREAEALDSERYQTVYGKVAGAVAAPTAGLHFDEALLARIRAKGVAQVAVTLHVGAGTFQPVRVEDLSAHVMHEEWLSVSTEVVQAVADCRARGGRVVAVGTTALRALESAAKSGELMTYQGDTNLFIRPGYQFKVVDALLTNFHLPESTLLMLVSAFAGFENIRKVYQYAIAHQYRFFSYGDAMFLPQRLE